MNQRENIYQEIRSKLNNLRQRKKRLWLWSGILFSLTWVLGLGLFLVSLEAVFHFSPTLRTIFLITAVVMACGFLVFWIGRPVYSLLFQKEKPDDDSLALEAGRTYPGIKDRLADSLQIYRAHQDQKTATSPSLAFEALLAVQKETEQLDFKEVPSYGTLRKAVRCFVVVAVLMILVSVFFQEPLTGALNRWENPTRHFTDPPAFQLTLHPGNQRIVQGDDVEIQVEVKGKIPEEIQLEIQTQGESAHIHPLREPFFYKAASVRKSFNYIARSNGIESSIHHIEVVQRPLVRLLQLEWNPPRYTRMGKRVLEPNVGDIEVLKGTRVRISVEANKPLSLAQLEFDRSRKRQMISEGSRARTDFIVNQEDHYRITLIDTMGLGNNAPISYSIGIQPDLFPVARILFPAAHVDLDETMEIPLTMEGEDDFGLSQCRLVYSIEKDAGSNSQQETDQFIPLQLDSKKATRADIQFVWQLDELNLYPEDVIVYYFEVWDNDNISGPKSGKSRSYTARFPSIYEIYEEVEAEHAHQVETLTDLHDEGQEIREELNRITDEMKGGRELEWEEKKNLEGLSEKQESLENKVEELSAGLDEMTDRMERHDLLSPEILDKYQELQQLYQEIASPELLEAMKKLQEEMDTLTQEELQKAAERFNLSQETFLKSMERTISLLKRLHVEQKTEELVRRMEDLAKRQEEVNQALTEESPLDTNKWAQNESRISEDMEALRKEMESLYQSMEDLPSMPLPQMEAVMESTDRKDLIEQTKRMAEMMQSGQNNQASAEGAEAQQSMSELLEMLKQMQEDLKNNQKERIANALGRTSFRMLQLSEAQENLKNETQGGKVDGNQAAEQQMSLLSGLQQVADSLAQLSKETFFITPEIGGAIGSAQAAMGRALKAMAESGGTGAMNHQSNSIGSLNRGVMAIQDVLGQLAGASSGLGMQEFLMRMDQMAQQQMGLNQQTMDMLNKGQLSLRDQAGMARLANEQSALKKALEDVLAEFSDQSSITGRLDQMIEDMGDVIEDLKQNRASQQTIQKQQRILSRLLDVQHSVRRRDFSRKRRGRTGEDVIRRSPGLHATDNPSWKEALRQDILRLNDEGYIKEYQDLIRAYFELLARDKDQ